MQTINVNTQSVILSNDVKEAQQVANAQLAAEEQPKAVKNTKAQVFIKQLMQGKRVKVAAAKEAGVKTAFALDVNRQVNKNHVKEICDSVKANGKFLLPIQAITAEEYFKFYPNRTLEVDGQVIGKDCPDLEDILVVLDGQHRTVAESELMHYADYVPSLKVELVELEGLEPDRWMLDTNCYNKNWCSGDRNHFIMANEPDPNTNIHCAALWKKKYGMSERAAYALLTRKDNYRMTVQLDYMKNPSAGLNETLKGTPEGIERAKEELQAMLVAFRKCPKMLRNMAAVKVIIRINDAAGHTINEEEKAQLARRIVTFFKTLDQDVALKANDEGSISAKENILLEEWDKVREDIRVNPGAWEVKAQEAEAEWMALEKAAEEEAQKKAEAKEAKKRAAEEKAKAKAANEEAKRAEKEAKAQKKAAEKAAPKKKRGLKSKGKAKTTTKRKAKNVVSSPETPAVAESTPETSAAEAPAVETAETPSEAPVVETAEASTEAPTVGAVETPAVETAETPATNVAEPATVDPAPVADPVNEDAAEPVKATPTVDELVELIKPFDSITTPNSYAKQIVAPMPEHVKQPSQLPSTIEQNSQQQKSWKENRRHEHIA